MHQIALIVCSTMFPALAPEAVPDGPSSAPAKVRKVAVGGDGGWDYLTVDPDARRLYVSRSNRVVVLDLDKEAVVGELADTPGVHGIAVVPDLGKGFTSNGSDSSVTVFDLKTLKATGKVKASGTPDAILYDPASQRVFTFNHGTDDTTAIDASAASVAGTLALGGEPEAAVADGKGHIFVNIRSKSEIAEFDARTLKVLNRWPLAPGTRPTGLAIDTEHRRLFSVCANQKMVVMDADKGTVIATPEIGRGSDGCLFDPSKGLAYSSNGGDGTVTVVGEGEPGQFKVLSTIPTQASARTMTLDPRSHRLYLSAATAAPAPAGTQPQTKGRRGYVPGSFVIVVVGD
jgi:DNA-binding beta-propeller fold protein YncE